MLRGALGTHLTKEQDRLGTNNKTQQATDDAKVIAGLQKHASTIPGLIVQGKTVTVAAAIAVLEGRIQAITAAQAARIAWLDAASQQKQQLASTKAFVDSLVTVIRGMYAGSPSTLADFGQTPRKVTTLTVAQKALADQKKLATREARHTMGPKQKAAIKGTVPAAPAATTAPPSVAPGASTATGTTGGGGTPPHS